MASFDEIRKYIVYPQIGYALLSIIAIIIIIFLLIYKGYTLIDFGFIITPALTILLIIIWDGYNSKNREESLIMAFVMELFFNIDALTNNCEMILKELNGFDEGQRMVNTLRPLNNEAWLIISSNTPKSLYRVDLLVKLAWVYYRITDINENIRSRENYRLSNAKMKNFKDIMISYDAVISTLTNSFIQVLEDFLSSENLKKELKDIKKFNNDLEELKSKNKKIEEYFGIM